MDARTAYEVIGYVASALIAVSQMMTSILKLRIINLVGSACFTVYGLLIGAYPIAIVNGLRKAGRRKQPLCINARLISS